MKPKKISYSPTFLRDLKKFPKSQLKNLAKQEKIFKENIFDPRLKTHNLTGKLSQFYSFSISYHWRIIFHFKDKEIVLDRIGTHAVYR